MFEVLLLVSVIYWLHMTLYYLLSVKIKDVSIIDVAWGAGPALASLALISFSEDLLWQQNLALSMVTVWGARLALHIFDRKKDSGEDWRYQKFRDQWGGSFVIQSYFRIFMVQLILSILVTLPIVAIGASESIVLESLFWIGVIVWIVGFYFEAKGDAELKNFIKKKQLKRTKKKFLTTGLWAYTRHPNYFGEVTQWFGLALIALSFGTSNAWAIIGPITITLLIFNVSGLNILEDKYAENKEWQKYAKRTNKFFPGPRRQ